MKVCTDSCLFGAWIADTLLQQLPANGSILDIGTGTGLLSLMLAQRCSAPIDAVEIDSSAAGQAADNIRNSPWKERIRLFHADIRFFDPGVHYSLILSNPPFYENELRSPEVLRNVAMHGDSLSLDDFFHAAARLLDPRGRLAVLFPAGRKQAAVSTALDKGLYLQESLAVSPAKDQPVFRYVLVFASEKPVQTVAHEMSVTTKGTMYTPEFAGLLKDYYLAL